MYTSFVLLGKGELFLEQVRRMLRHAYLEVVNHDHKISTKCTWRLRKVIITVYQSI